MHNIRSIGALAAVAAAIALAGCSSSQDATLGDGWELVWSDEFDGAEIDLDKWTHETNCWGGGNNELQCYTDRADNSFLRDGNLVIRAQEEQFTGPAEPIEWADSDPNVTATLDYTSARLVTKDQGDWTYGRIEVRAKVPGGQGAWPAIWMLPSDRVYGEWAASGEIDIFEAVNLGTTDEHAVHGTLHYGAEWPNNTASGEKYELATDPTEQFHTYAIEWAAGEIRWYVDDVHYATQTSAGWFSTQQGDGGELTHLTDGEPFDQAFHLLLNVAVGGAWPGSPDATTVFPLEMEVDFVRVYECPASPETLESCATAQDGATAVAGNQPPEKLAIDYDPNFIFEDTVVVFDDEPQGPYALDTWAGSGSVEATLVEDAERGMVTRLEFNSDQSVVFWQSEAGFDYSAFAFVEFDVFVVEDPRADGQLQMKTDCFHPCGTGDFSLGDAVVGEWVHYKVAFDDLVGFPGSTLDVTNINTPLVISPSIGDQEGVVMLVDNVTVSRE